MDPKIKMLFFSIPTWLLATMLFYCAFSFAFESALFMALFLVACAVACTFLGCWLQRLCEGGKSNALKVFVGFTCGLSAIALTVLLVRISVRGATGVEMALGAVFDVLLCGVCCFCFDVIDCVRRAREKREKTSVIADLSNRASIIESAVPVVISDLFDGWPPRRLDVSDDRACAPTADGSWARMGSRGVVFKLSDEQLAAYVCTDAVLIARACMRRILVETEGGSVRSALTPGRFVYNKVHLVTGEPDEAVVMARLLEGLVFCRRIMTYEDLRIEIKPVDAGVSSCRVSFKATLAWG